MDTSNLYYGDEFDYFEEEELTPEEQLEADKAYIRNLYLEAMGDFYDSPYSFDQELGGAPRPRTPIYVGIKKALENVRGML